MRGKSCRTEAECSAKASGRMGPKLCVCARVRVSWVCVCGVCACCARVHVACTHVCVVCMHMCVVYVCVVYLCCMCVMCPCMLAHVCVLCAHVVFVCVHAHVGAMYAVCVRVLCVCMCVCGWLPWILLEVHLTCLLLSSQEKGCGSAPTDSARPHFQDPLAVGCPGDEVLTRGM